MWEQRSYREIARSLTKEPANTHMSACGKSSLLLPDDEQVGSYGVVGQLTHLQRVKSAFANDSVFDRFMFATET